MFLLCFPMYILIKENHQKHDTPTTIEADKEESDKENDNNDT